MENLKAVIYARYSSSSQREESIEGQVKECTAFAEWYSDHDSLLSKKWQYVFSESADCRRSF